MDHDRRQHARLDAMVEVSVRQGAKVTQLNAANISAGGMFLELDAGVAYPGVAVGDELTVHLDMGSDRFGRPLEIRTPAEVVRIDLGGPGRHAGFAVMWSSSDPALVHSLAVVLEYLLERARRESD
jgi:c-di-GMP-binding flagellar brake protein YcgR